MDEAQLAQMRASARAMWSAGEYPAVAQRLVPAAALLVERASIGAGDRVLDVGTGSGSVAVLAARQGASVTGIDLTDAWFDHARAAAAVRQVPVNLLEGDAEDMPFSDGKFDAVVSNFAHIFAPRHDVVTAEMVRVCRPGGTIACTAWATDPHAQGTGAFAIMAR